MSEKAGLYFAVGKPRQQPDNNGKYNNHTSGFSDERQGIMPDIQTNRAGIWKMIEWDLHDEGAVLTLVNPSVDADTQHKKNAKINKDQ